MRTDKKNKRSSRVKKSSRTGKSKDKKNRLQLKVGQPWAEEFKIAIEHRDSVWKSRIAVLAAVCLLMQLCALTAYGMVTGNADVLSHAVAVNRTGLVIVGIWATGKAALKVLSRWRDS